MFFQGWVVFLRDTLQFAVCLVKIYTMRKLLLATVFCILPLTCCIAATYGPVTKNEQLWQIAATIRPDLSVSIEQTMRAIWQKNQEAFVDDDLNKLKPDVILDLPTLGEIQQIPFAEAQKQIQTNDKYPLDNSAELAKVLFSLDHQYQAKLTALNAENSELKKDLQHFEQVQQTLQNALNQPNQFKIFTSYLLSLRNETMTNHSLRFGLWAISFMLFGFMLYLLKPRRNLQAVSSSQNETFPELADLPIGTEEIVAKLDLARAYFDMGEKTTAKRLIVEIIRNGNEEQRLEAQKLLSKIVY